LGLVFLQKGQKEKAKASFEKALIFPHQEYKTALMSNPKWLWLLSSTNPDNMLHIRQEELPVSLTEFKQKALFWAATFRQMAYYESNQIPYPYQGFLNLLGVSQLPFSFPPDGQAFVNLRDMLTDNTSLLCGMLAYDLKNEVETLSSYHPDQVGFPGMHFFCPQIFLLFGADSIRIHSSNGKNVQVLEAILETNCDSKIPSFKGKIQQRVSREKYLETVEKIRKEIFEGQVYELNYCLEFFALNQMQLNPVGLFLALNQASPMPFSGIFKVGDRYLLCASPERFLKKEGNLLISQPIKGTVRRGKDAAEDKLLRQQLRENEKERAENMMIVDLVRNDLRRSCRTGTIQVEEMFGIYGFRHVSQMISTVTGRLRPECDLVDALRGAFPMGSMTGAPKVRAMELIEKYECTRRGLFSGSIGYVLPNGDADFNVVIRSLQYNQTNGYLSFLVGSAITYDSNPALEYEECLLKAKAILQVLGLD
jgi:para-aminobenzoate synthetase component I